MGIEQTGNRVLVIRHGDDPPDDRAHTYLWTRGYEPVVLRPFRGEAIDPLDDGVAGVILHGGPFPVYEEDAHPFLRDEHRLIEACLERDRPMLGICQGAQSIAHVLGARVGPPDHGLHEFGYYEIRATPEGRDVFPETLRVAQAHFHGFEVPDGGVRLAESDAYPNQAFRYGAAYGVQFHAEQTIEAFRRWQVADWTSYDEPGAQSRQEQDRLAAHHDATQAAWFYGFLERLFPSRVDAPMPLV